MRMNPVPMSTRIMAQVILTVILLARVECESIGCGERALPAWITARRSSPFKLFHLNTLRHRLNSYKKVAFRREITTLL
jgi:hypothetical protein